MLNLDVVQVRSMHGKCLSGVRGICAVGAIGELVDRRFLLVTPRAAQRFGVTPLAHLALVAYTFHAESHSLFFVSNCTRAELEKS